MPATTETIPKWKEEEVARLEETIRSYDSVGIVDVEGIPSRQLQIMRRDIHDTTVLRISRNTLIVRALEAVDEGFEDLVEYVAGPIGLILTNENPFTLYRQLEASKTPAPISAGEVAPNDIVIEAGDTGIDPGPFVGDLQNVGVPARIDEGSIKVMETTTVCEAGEEVSFDLEGVLNELELEPKEVGLDLRAVFADGVVFEAADLELDIDEYRAQFASGSSTARSLAFSVGYPASGVVELFLQEANADASQLALAAGYLTEETASTVLSAAQQDGIALASSVDDEDAIPQSSIPADLSVEPTAEEQEAPTDQPAADDAADEDDEDEPEDTEEEASGEGLGDLFG